MTLAPLIPYVQIPDLVLLSRGALGGDFPPAPFSFKPFGTLVALGVYVGAWLALRQARKVGLDQKRTMSFLMWVAGIGFLGAHVFDTLFYFPERVAADPLSVLRIWEGLSSFGGFLGAVIGLFVWKWRYRVPALPHADMCASAFPVAWVFGRTGCAVAHDHPGLPSELWLAVQYPDGGRFDLGLYEMVLTIPIAIAFLLLRRKPRPWGFYLGLFAVAYAPSRFALDFLRIREGVVADARYFALTPAQWACFALLAAGIALLWYALERGATVPAALPVETTPTQ